jgi:hypothetical protein
VGVGVGESVGVALGETEGDAVTTADGGADGAGLRVARTTAAITNPRTTTTAATTAQRCHVQPDGGMPSPGVTG